MNVVDFIEKENQKSEIPKFRIGDTVRVYMRIVEGEKERTQVIEGVVIAMKGGGVRETFTIRKVSSGIGVEMKFPIHSPRVEKVQVVRSGRVRRAKLYFLRQRKGKSARLEEVK